MLKTFIHKGCDSFHFFFFFDLSLFPTTTYGDHNPLNIEEGEGWTGGAWDPEWGGSVLPLGRKGQGVLGNLGPASHPSGASPVPWGQGKGLWEVTQTGALGVLSPLHLGILGPHEMDPGCLGSVFGSVPSQLCDLGQMI